MFMTTDLYLKRLCHALEHVIAPELESDRVRGQVFAVISLLDQLGSRIEYKPALIAQEIEMGKNLLDRLLRLMAESGVEPDPELREFLARVQAAGAPADLSTRGQVDEKVCQAIDWFFAARDRLSPDAHQKADGVIRDYITRLATRDLGLMKPPNFDKISRSRREPKQP